MSSARDQLVGGESMIPALVNGFAADTEVRKSNEHGRILCC